MGSVIRVLFLDVLRFHFQKITQNWWKPDVLKDITDEDLFRRDLFSALNMHDWGQLNDLNKRWESFKCIFTLISGMHAHLMTWRVRSEYTPWV